MKYLYVKSFGGRLDNDGEPVEIDSNSDRGAKRLASRYSPAGDLYYATTGRPVARRSSRLNKWVDAEFLGGKWWFDGEDAQPLFKIEPTNALRPF